MSITKNTTNEDFNKLKDEMARLKKSIEELSMLNDFARIISSTLSLDKIMDKVVSASVKAINAEQGTIHLLETTESQDPFKTLIRKADQTTPESKYRLDAELSGWMIKHQKPLIINDFSKEELFKERQATDKKISSILSVPLMCKGKLIGVVNLFNKKAEGEFSSDDQRLLSIIASQSAQVIENARLYKEEKQLRQFEQELEMARAIQNKLLPKENPEIEGFDIAGVSYAAKEVGGDYFDFIELGNNRWGIALGDVSGKGIPAALLMSTLQATLRNQALTISSLIDCITKANKFLYLNTDANKFVTLFCGVLDSKSKKFNYVNAGHNFPFHLDKKGEFRDLNIGGLILGIMADCQFEEGNVQLHPDEIIVIYSDGVSEADNELDEMFGDKRLKEIVWQNKHLSSQQIISRIYDGIKEFTGPIRQEDDITLIVIKTI